MDIFKTLTRRGARDMTIQADAAVIAAVRDRWGRSFELHELRHRLEHTPRADGSDFYALDGEPLVEIGPPRSVMFGVKVAARRTVTRYASPGTKVPVMRFDRVPSRYADPLVALASRVA